MIQPFSHPDFNRNQDRCGDKTPCVVCGKGIRDMSKVGSIRVGGGGASYLPPTAPVESGDMGWFPIGNDCRRNNPDLEPWVVGP